VSLLLAILVLTSYVSFRDRINTFSSTMTINIYPDLLHGNPPSEFSEDIDAACQEVHEACKGWGANEQ
jgi:hypothetical protein